MSCRKVYVNSRLLDLGRFTKRIEILSPNQASCYSACSGTKVFYCIDSDRNITSEFVGDCFYVPTFEIGGFTNQGDISDKLAIGSFLAYVELEILSIINKLRSKSDCFDLFKMSILIRNIELHYDKENETYFGLIEVGVVVFVGEKPERKFDRGTVAVIIGEVGGQIRMVRVHPNTRLAKQYIEKELIRSNKMVDWLPIEHEGGNIIYQHKSEDRRFTICIRLIDDE